MASNRCPECDDWRGLSWTVTNLWADGIPNGRYNNHDARPALVLGCELCSETVLIVDAASIQGEDLLAQIATVHG